MALDVVTGVAVANVVEGMVDAWLTDVLSLDSTSADAWLIGAVLADDVLLAKAIDVESVVGLVMATAVENASALLVTLELSLVVRDKSEDGAAAAAAAAEAADAWADSCDRYDDTCGGGDGGGELLGGGFCVVSSW